MRDSLFSPSWYRIAKVKPRLRSHTEIHRHYYRGEKWYVLQDHITGKFYRFTPVAYHVIGLMSGGNTVQEIWEKTIEEFGDDAPTQEEMLHLLGQLHAADVLLSDVPPDTAELLKRSKEIDDAKKKAIFQNPLFLKIPLFDPERFLEKRRGFFRLFFSYPGMVLWLVTVISAVILGSMHWGELTRDLSDRVLSASNIFILWFSYPFIKAVHELSHAYAVKKWGGEVHEMGIMLLVLMPIPYVDASASIAFRSKWQRILVDAAGILAELFIASLALLLWVSLEPGLVKSVCYNLVLIGSVSTVIFNGNPLLRYDGYYILADFLNIPNLAQRGLQYYQYILKRYLFGLVKTIPPYTGPGERFWLVVFSAASFVYRLFVYWAIALFIAGKFFVIGVLLAIWSCIGMFVIPLGKGISFLASSPVLRENRGGAIVKVLVLVALIVGGLFFLPFPSYSVSEGVLWVSDECMVRAGGNGFIQSVDVQSGDRVHEGQMVADCRNRKLDADIQRLTAQLKEYELRYGAAIAKDKVLAQQVKEEQQSIAARLERAEEERRNLEIRSSTKGQIVIPQEEDLLGRFIHKGELLGYILAGGRQKIRVVVPQTEVELIRHHTKRVELKLAERINQTVDGVIIREIPSAVEELPSTVLGSAGGGKIAVDPTEKTAKKALEDMFEFEVELAKPIDRIFIGSRAYVRFQHDPEPLGFQLYRKIRQLFLKRFNV